MNKKFVQEIIYKGKNQRLDLVVSEAFNVTRSKAQKMIKEGMIFLNDALARTKDDVSVDDKIQMFEQLEVEKKSPEIIFEDKDIMIINKPAGISVHPAAGEKDKTVTEYFQKKLDFPKNDVRPGVVHRLDKGTSGVMILAKNSKALEFLQKEFKNRNVKKTYVALIHGHIKPDVGVINMPIQRDENKKEKMTVHKEGKEAVTEFRTVKLYHDFALLELYPKTGRMHQIRVHLSALGYPIVGDKKYGMHGSKESKRIFLHAKRVEFRHPKNEDFVSFEVDIPNELKNYLAQIN